MASFYLGAAGGASVTYYNVHAEYPRQYAYAGHLGDSWRYSPKLTLNYSLRWDYISPFKEKFDNLSFLDPEGANPTATSPITGAALKGRIAYAGNKWGTASYGSDFPEVAYKAALAPRVGFAYTLNEKTVLRAGYGIYFGQAFYPGWNGGMSQDGFNKSLSLNESSNGNFKSPALYLASGISASQVGSTASNINSSYDNGTSPSMYRPYDGNHRPYSSQWNLTIERQLPHSFLTSISYVGTRGTHLPSALRPLNVLNPNISSILAMGSDLSVSYSDANGPATFAKYGYGTSQASALNLQSWAGMMSGCAPTLAQALLPYPQYCGRIQGQNEEHGKSFCNSFQGKIERHLTNGIYFLGSMTLQKLFTNASDSTQSTNDIGSGNQGSDGQFSPFNVKKAWALAPDNVPLTAQIAAVYDLPFGANKPLLNSLGVANPLVAGWQISPVFRYEHGTPFSFYSSACATSTIAPEFREGCVPGILPGQRVQPQGRNGFSGKGTYLNASAFESDFSTFGYTGSGQAVTNIYGPNFRNIDFSLTKNTKIMEKATFKFEANFFNAFNNHYFINSQGGNYGGPSVAFNTDVSNPSAFGKWNGAVSGPRTIQFAGRIEF